MPDRMMGHPRYLKKMADIASELFELWCADKDSMRKFATQMENDTLHYKLWELNIDTCEALWKRNDLIEIIRNMP